MTPSPSLLLVHTSCPEDAAPHLIQALLAQRLIACAHISAPLQSFYTWQGALTHTQEVMITLKTSSSLREALFTRLAFLHPYEVPELWATTPQHTSKLYLDWVLEVTRPPEAAGPRS